MQLADRLGVWANCNYPFPNAFINDIFSKLFTDLPQRSPFDPEIMTWNLMKILPELPDKEQFAPLKSYFHDSRQIKLFQLSTKIADQFDQYTVYRPEMILGWEQGKGDHWQALLWRELVSANKNHRTHLMRRLLDLLNNEKPADAVFPERISVFGISSLPQFHTEILQAISSVVDLHLFVLNPCKEYWDDIVSEKEAHKILSKLRKNSKRIVAAPALHFDQGNPLLASWGKYGRDFLTSLHNRDIEEYSVTVDPGDTTMLTSLQSDILYLRSGDKKRH